MYKILKFDLARNALKYLIKTYKIKEMKIPYYLCDVVRHTLVAEGCKPIFYHIDDKFYPSEEFSEEDFILYPNYWGICNNNVNILVKKYPKLIVDNAHAYFNEPSGFACFNAGHKFGYNDSFLWINISKNNEQSDNDNKFYSDENICILRKWKFQELHKKYKNMNLLHIDMNSIPFCYPCLVDTTENADKLVKTLKQEGNVIYRYWNFLPKNYNEYKFYSRLVPIPIEIVPTCPESH